jgi:hypothetical protein
MVMTKQGRYDLWVDFDAVFDGRLQSLLRYAKNPPGIRKGERITVGNHTGARARADVLYVDTRMVVYLDIDWTTYAPG